MFHRHPVGDANTAITAAASARACRETARTYTPSILRDVCTMQGLSTTGGKSVLIDRLAHHLWPEHPADHPHPL